MRTVLIDQHRTFFSQLPFVLLGGVDVSGQPWATMLTGKPGFTSSPDPQRLHIATLPANADPLSNAIQVGAKRLLRFHITRIVRLNAVLPFTWSAPDYARQTINTGTWLEAEQNQRPE